MDLLLIYISKILKLFVKISTTKKVNYYFKGIINNIKLISTEVFTNISNK